MTDAKDKGGRPSDWRPEYVELCKKLALLGWTDEEIAKHFKISVRTFYKWKKAHPELAVAMRYKEIADAEVLNALFQSAIGKTVTTKKVLGTGENARVVEVTEHVPPNVMACMYLLNNRQRSRFSRNPDPITDPDEPIPASVTVTVEDASVDDAEAK